MPPQLQPPIRVSFVCDFFYPQVGGVETHIFQLALALISQGHKAIIITRAYDQRQGVRYMTNGLKVYYCPFQPLPHSILLPTLYGSLPLLRHIWYREDIHIVHAHTATSPFAAEALLHAKTLGYKTVFTDHSLFGFCDAACFHVNKLLKFILSDLDHAICVSHTSKENLTLRATLNPALISVIPNAVDPAQFKPDPSQQFPRNKINIVIVNRLAYRKGVDLLIDVIPQICSDFPEAHFIIGGDGPKRNALQTMITKHKLAERVELVTPYAIKF